MFKPDKKAPENAWRVLYGIPDSMTRLLTPPQWQWEMVILRWSEHEERETSRVDNQPSSEDNISER
jgi:hypothetical protein